jgi:dihydroorotate dehydrogenase
MNLHGIEFGRVLGASGVQGFFGEGYWYHRPWKPFGLRFDGMTFVAKTTTLFARQGNMPLNADGITPTERLPKCIVVKPWKGVALNSVGLSGPGALRLLDAGRWQSRTAPFLISFMSVQPTMPERHEELRQFVALLASSLPRFKAAIGLQINFSCSNVGIHHEGLALEIESALMTAGRLGVPLVPKLAVTAAPALAERLGRNAYCAAICVSNTIPWGSYPDRIDWQKLFGSETSPLASVGGGGLSGAPLLPFVIEWVRAARVAGYRKPFIVGGGILSLADVRRLVSEAGVDLTRDAVSLGSIAFLRPWRVRGIIRAVNAAT